MGGGARARGCRAARGAAAPSRSPATELAPSRSSGRTFRERLQASREALRAQLEDQLPHSGRRLGPAGRRAAVQTQLALAGGVPHVRHLNEVVKALGDIGRADEALELFREMQSGALEREAGPGGGVSGGGGANREVSGRRGAPGSMEPNKITWCLLMDGFANQKDWRGVRSLMAEMRDAGLSVGVMEYNALVKAYIAAGDLVGAQETTYEEMLEVRVPPDANTYNMLIHGLASKKGKSREARGVLDRMVRQGVKPNRVTYASLINAYAVNQEAREAELALEEMRDAGLQPNSIVYNTVLKAYSTVGAPHQMRGLMQRMEEDGLPCNVRSYSTLTAAYGRANLPYHARAVLKEMRSKGLVPNVVTYTAAVTALGRAGDLDGAREVIEEMRRNGVKPDEWTFGGLMGAYADAGELAQATDLLHQMAQMGVRPNRVMYGILVDAAFEHWLRMGRLPVHLREVERFYKHTRCDTSPARGLTRGSNRVLQIDLHKLSKWTAVVYVVEMLRLLQDVLSKNPESLGGSDVEIVTGRGNHSTYLRQPVLRDVILVLLQQMGIPVAFTAGNDGCLLVRGRQLGHVLNDLTKAGVVVNLEYASQFI